MKGNELMIGDIVAVNNTPLQIAALGTAKAGFVDAKGEMFYHYYDNIEPILLTKDILNKNFDFHTIPSDGIHPKDEFWLLVEKPKRVWLQQYATSVFVQIDTKDEYGCECRLLQIKVLHVHELQHALKLCGIDKEIEL